MKNYIVRLSDKVLSFYQKEQGIVYKCFENGFWRAEETLVSDNIFSYRVAINAHQLVVYYRNNRGENFEIKSTHLPDLRWHSEKIPTTATHEVHKRGESLLLTDEKNTLILAKSDDDHVQVDKYKWFRGCDLQIQDITPDHSLVFYQSAESPAVKNAEGKVLVNIGYREVTPENFGEFKPIHTSHYQIIDSSFLTTKAAIHTAYVVKNLFSYQLVYKCKTQLTFDEPLLITEGSRLDNPVLTIVNDKVYVFFETRTGVYFSVKEKRGFTKPKPYKNKICKNIQKAQYLSQNDMTETEYFTREVYVDKICPWDVQILPDLYPKFYFMGDSQVVQTGPFTEAPNKVELKPTREPVPVAHQENATAPTEDVPPHWHFEFGSFGQEQTQQTQPTAQDAPYPFEDMTFERLSSEDILRMELDKKQQEVDFLRKQEDIYVAKIEAQNQMISELIQANQFAREVAPETTGREPTSEVE